MKWQAKHTSLLVIAIGFGVFYFIFRKEWMLTPIGVCFIGFLIGPVGDFIHIIWMQLAKLLGYINSRILLSIIFFLLLTPIALLMRMLSKTQFVKKTGGRQSLFVSRFQLYTKQDLEQPF
jgi:Saxitoxin biosynthesis operon protein SxtJ